MPKSEKLYVPSRYLAFTSTFTNADGTGSKTLFTAPVDDANLIMLSVTSTENAQVTLRLYLSISGQEALIGYLSVPSEAGYGGVSKAVNGLDATALPFLPIDDTGLNRYLPLNGGVLLKASVDQPVSAGKVVTITGIAGDYGV